MGQEPEKKEYDTKDGRKLYKRQDILIAKEKDRLLWTKENGMQGTKDNLQKRYFRKIID